MTPASIKAVFRQYLPAKRMLVKTIDEAKILRRAMCGISGGASDGMPRSKGRVSDPVARAVEKLQMAEQRLEEASERYQAALEQMETLLALADDTLGVEIIRLRWMKDIGFDFIPAEIHLQRSAMFQHYEAAISQISCKTSSAD